MTGITAQALNKVSGLNAVLRDWRLDRPPILVLGDGLEDFELMRHVSSWPTAFVACPESARSKVRDYVQAQGGVIYPSGRADIALELAGRTGKR